MKDGENTKSVCPVCLRALPAKLTARGDAVYISRTCPEHGAFSGLVWKGEPALDRWMQNRPLAGGVRCETETGQGCPHDCGRCPQHEQHACTVLFEITSRCNLACPVCFANAGNAGNQDQGFAPLGALLKELKFIREHAGDVVLQLSGGEPTLHPDLPALTREARRLFSAVQLNTNGLALAARPELAHELAAAGLSWVFLQFDGSSDSSFMALRGMPLLEQKLEAVRNCAEAGLAVVLVPTVARGVNDNELGDLLRLAIALAPTVRGLHLQPMTASGRNRLAPLLAAGGAEPLTLPEVLQKLCEQSGGLVRPEHATAPNCEHSRCSFHCRYQLTPSGLLKPLRDRNLSGSDPGGCCSGNSMAGQDECGGEREYGSARRAIDVIMRVWQGGGPDTPRTSDAPDALATFIAEARSRAFSVTCMAFQDVMNLDLARLRRCCVHVFARPDRLIPFCAYNLTALDGAPLYRR